METRTVACTNCTLPVGIDNWDPQTGGFLCPKCGTVIPILDEETALPDTAPISVQGRAEAEIEIPGYEVVEEIGRGAMGVVLRASQISLNRPVAIKVLAPELLGDPDFVARFDREADILSRLNHPHIVSVFDRGRIGTTSFIVMEFVGGPDGQVASTLGDLLKDGAIEVERTRELAIQIADALQSAHEAGMVHRDLKPGNILVDQRGNAKVVDFGIASLDGRTGDPELTLVGKPIGTPDYMAPEQWQDGASADQRSDIFSLGVILYEMLAGQLPAGAFPAASTCKPGVSENWDGIVNQLLQPDPNQRYQSMALVKTDLESLPGLQVTQVEIPDEFACPTCSEQIRQGAAACANCGMDVQQAVTHFQKMVLGERHLTAANESETHEDQLSFLDQAAVAFETARDACPGTTVNQQLRQVNEQFGSIALEEAQQAISTKDFSAATRLLNRAQEATPSNETATLLQWIETERRKQLEKINSHLDAGRIADAVEQLKKAERYFQDDPEFTTLLQQHRPVAEQVTNAIENRFPELLQQRRYFGVLALIQELADRGARAKELDRLRSRVEQKLNGLQEGVAYAQQALDKSAYDTVNQICQKLLAKCADHNDVISIQEQAQRRRDALSQAKSEIRKAVEARRWHVASHWLEVLNETEAATRWAVAARRKIDQGCQRVSRHKTLVLFSLLGCAVFVLSHDIVQPIQTSLVDPLTSLLSGESQTIENWVRQVTPCVIPLGLMSLATTIVMSLSGTYRPRRHLSILATALAAGVAIGSVEPILNSEWARTADSDSILEMVHRHREWLATQIHASLFGLAMALVVAIQWAPHEVHQRRRWTVVQTCLTGILIGFLANALPSGQYLIRSHAACGLFVAGGLLVSGLCFDLNRLMAILLVSVMSGVVCGILSRTGDAWSPSTVTQINAIAVAVCCVVIVPFRGAWQRLVTMAFTWGLAWIFWQISAIPEFDHLVVLISVWAAVCGIIARRLVDQTQSTWQPVDKLRTLFRRHPV